MSRNLSGVWFIVFSIVSVTGERPRNRQGGEPLPTPTHRLSAYLLQDADGVPAALQPGGEAGRGGGVVVLGGLPQELTH